MAFPLCGFLLLDLVKLDDHHGMGMNHVSGCVITKLACRLYVCVLDFVPSICFKYS